MTSFAERLFLGMFCLVGRGLGRGHAALDPQPTVRPPPHHTGLAARVRVGAPGGPSRGFLDTNH